MAKISATEVRSGILIEWEKRLWRVVKSRHVHVGGRGGAYMQVEVKDIETGSKNNIRMHTDDKVERPFVETRKMRYLYAEEGGYIFMDEENYEQLTLENDFFEDREGYLIPDILIDVLLYEGRVIGATLPTSVVVKIVQTDPQAKGSTVTSSYKPAQVETGITVMVPPFIEEGIKIRISTDSGEYLERE
ncbi:MAG: elongation factor P [Proteobacteria bacterium]|nr:elongation factor P [Pseudomonadota bacterium]MCH9758961.1 elongation factor P [Pseudomonadota bacterium]